MLALRSTLRQCTAVSSFHARYPCSMNGHAARTYEQLKQVVWMGLGTDVEILQAGFISGLLAMHSHTWQHKGQSNLLHQANTTFSHI